MPYLIKDIDKLERVLRRATRIVKHLKFMTHKDRLKELEVFVLKKGRLRENMRSVFKDKKVCHAEEEEVSKFVCFCPREQNWES